MWGDSGIVLGANGYNDPAILVRTTGNNYVASPERNTYKYFDENGNVFYTGSVVWLENIISDGFGGIIFSSRGGQWPENWQLRTQRKDSLGNSLWQEPHIVVAESLYINTINKIINNDGLYFFSWSGKKNGVDVVAQFQALRQDGTKLFAQGSLPISNYPVDALIGNILPSDSGTFVLIWQDYRPDDGVFGQRIDTLGNKKWKPSDVPLYTGMYADLYSITDGLGGAIGLGWHQFDFSIRAFKVSKYGVLGEVITNVNESLSISIPDEIFLYQNYPNPFNPSTVIEFSIPEDVSNVKLSIYNTLGQKVAELVNSSLTAGKYSYQWNAQNVATGMYIYELRTDKFVSVKKMVLLR